MRPWPFHLLSYSLPNASSPLIRGGGKLSILDTIIIYGLLGGFSDWATEVAI